jgi:lysophospholipase L1-like esterase
VVVGLAAAFGVIEVLLRTLNPFDMRVRGERIVLQSNSSWTYASPPGSQLDPEIIHRKNNIGFRGPDWAGTEPDRLRVFTVGGSTTENVYLTEGSTWPDQLTRLLEPHFPDLLMNNAGLTGHSTFGHAILLHDHLSRYEPDVLIYLVGINDISREDLHDWERDDMRGLSWSGLANASEVVALTLNIRRALAARKRRITHNLAGLNESWLITWEISDETRRALVDFARGLTDDYAARLRALVLSSLELGSHVVLVTQPAVYGEGIDDRTALDLSRIYVDQVDGGTAWDILEMYNDVTRAVAIELGVPLVDLARALPKSSRYFYDTIHFTNEGASKVAEILAGEICPYLASAFPERLGAPCSGSPILGHGSQPHMSGPDRQQRYPDSRQPQVTVPPQ